MVMVNTV